MINLAMQVLIKVLVVGDIHIVVVSLVLMILLMRCLGVSLVDLGLTEVQGQELAQILESKFRLLLKRQLLVLRKTSQLPN